MLEELKKNVYQACMDLVKHELVIFTWGNVSIIDRAKGQVVIKPSGASYDEMKANDMVVLDLDGNKLEGEMRPSSDSATHLYLYKNFPDIDAIVHTHSEWATSWAQARRSIPAYGTTHADYFYGEIPCTRSLSEEEVKNEYELNTGKVIVETFRHIDPLAVPGVLVAQHGPFSWGRDPAEAVHNAKVLDEVARMAYRNETLGNRQAIDPYLLDKHYRRKHGKDAYYGQK
jgi:L-ribulose-5-phosphate 4-epimerase